MASKKKSVPLTEFLRPDNNIKSWADEEMEEGPDVGPLPTAPGQGSSSVGSPTTRSSGAAAFGRELPDAPPYKVYMGNVSYDLTDAAVRDLFRDSRIQDIHILKHHDSQKPKGAFVEFSTKEELADALTRNGENFLGRPVRIDIAEARPERGRGGFGGSRSGGGGFADSYGRDRGGASGGESRRGGGFSDRGGFGDRYGEPRGFGGDRDRGFSDRGYGDRDRGFSDRGPRGGGGGFPPREYEGDSRGSRGGYSSRGGHEEGRPEERRGFGSGFDRERRSHDEKLPRHDYAGFAGGRENGGGRWAHAESGSLASAPRAATELSTAGSAKTSDAGDAPAAEPSAAARPKLTLQPKQSGELEGPAKPKANPFGSAKPVDTSSKLKEFEERIAKEKAEKRHQEQLEQRNSSRELSQELPSLPAAAQAGPQQQAPPSAKVQVEQRQAKAQPLPSAGSPSPNSPARASQDPRSPLQFGTTQAPLPGPPQGASQPPVQPTGLSPQAGAHQADVGLGPAAEGVVAAPGQAGLPRQAPPPQQLRQQQQEAPQQVQAQLPPPPPVNPWNKAPASAPAPHILQRPQQQVSPPPQPQQQGPRPHLQFGQHQEVADTLGAREVAPPGLQAGRQRQPSLPQASQPQQQRQEGPPQQRPHAGRQQRGLPGPVQDRQASGPEQLQQRQVHLAGVEQAGPAGPAGSQPSEGAEAAPKGRGRGLQQGPAEDGSVAPMGASRARGRGRGRGDRGRGRGRGRDGREARGSEGAPGEGDRAEGGGHGEGTRGRGRGRPSSASAQAAAAAAARTLQHEPRQPGGQEEGWATPPGIPVHGVEESLSGADGWETGRPQKARARGKGRSQGSQRQQTTSEPAAPAPASSATSVQPTQRPQQMAAPPGLQQPGPKPEVTNTNRFDLLNAEA